MVTSITVWYVCPPKQKCEVQDGKNDNPCKRIILKNSDSHTDIK